MPSSPYTLEDPNRARSIIRLCCKTAKLEQACIDRAIELYTRFDEGSQVSSPPVICVGSARLGLMGSCVYVAYYEHIHSPMSHGCTAYWEPARGEQVQTHTIVTVAKMFAVRPDYIVRGMEMLQPYIHQHLVKPQQLRSNDVIRTAVTYIESLAGLLGMDRVMTDLATRVVRHCSIEQGYSPTALAAGAVQIVNDGKGLGISITTICELFGVSSLMLDRVTRVMELCVCVLANEEVVEKKPGFWFM